MHLRHVDTDIGSYHMAAGKSCYLLRLFDKLGVHFSSTKCRSKRGDIDSSIQFFRKILFIRKRGAIHPRGLRILP